MDVSTFVSDVEPTKKMSHLLAKYLSPSLATGGNKTKVRTTQSERNIKKNWKSVWKDWIPGQLDAGSSWFNLTYIFF